jgi:D,D-heptose 1,7-bisphosphate phosphatase
VSIACPTPGLPTPTFGVFLDRDGTLVVNDGYLAEPAALELLPHAREALELLRSAGARLLLVTNQSGVARGLFSEEQLLLFHDALQARLGHPFDAIYYCPHHPDEGAPPYRQSCRCRKPGTGMLERGLSDWGLDPRMCYIVGDSDLDVSCGRAMQFRTVQVVNPARTVSVSAPPDHLAGGLLEAARWILEDRRRRTLSEPSPPGGPTR